MADILKETAALVYPKKAKEIYAPNKTKETRDLLNKISLEIKALNGNDYYMRKALEQFGDASHTVISDVRFYAEAKALLDRGDYVFVWLGKPDKNYDLELLYDLKDVLLPSKPNLEDVADEFRTVFR